VKVAPKANFPYVISNYDFSGAPEMGAFTHRYIIKTLSGVRIGIFGLGVSFENLVLPGLHEGVRYLDALRAAGEITAELRKKHSCDMVICLSHIGYKYANDRVSDQVVANEVDGIDLIIGGHTHTLLEEPELVEKAGKSPTVISQVGHAGVVLGRLDFQFDRRNRIQKLLVGHQAVNSECDSLA
jgi:5'-nucleotidase